jgi:diguanylate cyclase
MPLDQLFNLKLRDKDLSLADALKPMLDRAVGLLARMLSLGDEDRERLAIVAKLNEFRTAVAGAADATTIVRLGESCFALCEAAIDQGTHSQTDRRTELARLVALVRDTVSLLAGNGDSFSSDVVQAAGRFNALLGIGDVHQLKQELVAEVAALQRLATNRQRQWKEAASMFETRVQSLETQLVIVKQEASIDPLTGVGNRREFENAFRDQLQRVERQFFVAVFDLDDFKRINDTGGHAAGNDVLRTVAQTLKNMVRKADVVARIGGDEFALLGDGATLREAEYRLRTFVTRLATIPTGLADRSHVTVSCGVAEFSAGDTMDSLMERADGALYEAKRQGKNQLAVKSLPFIRDLKKR